MNYSHWTRSLVFIVFFVVIRQGFAFMGNFFNRPSVRQQAVSNARKYQFRQPENLNDQSVEVPFTRKFVLERDWSTVADFWDNVVSGRIATPDFCLGNNEFSEYGVTHLAPFEAIGERFEFHSRDQHYTTRKTFAVRVGYSGTHYCGYQMNSNVPTVELTLRKALGVVVYAAGRTDKGVSAISQIVAVISRNSRKQDFTAEEILEKINNSQDAKDGKIIAYEAYRVPKRLSPRDALWRRYLFMFPLKSDNADFPKLDLDFMNLMQSK